ncbi:MAG TPA: outer membrane lipoprotein carrier protein LolA [Candidatus Angelobacter sp.]|nr:outer membrane lipoprotein carrier protein LolA [Candidatus Angelobacter sp.]
MKKLFLTIAVLVLPAVLLLASGPVTATSSAAKHAPKAHQTSAPSAPAQSAAAPQDLKSLLAEMDQAAATFKSAQADFEWDQYQKVVDEHDIQKGQIYFRKTKGGMDAAVKVVSPDPKQVLFKDGKLSLYQPRIDQVTEYKAGQNRGEVESFMSLGFGASGTDLARNFVINLQGWDTVDGVRTARLDLTPKQEKVKASLSHVLLWMDPKRNVSIKQQFFEPSGDYRLTHYTNIKLNGRISDDVFRLKTTSNTKIVQPQ